MDYLKHFNKKLRKSIQEQMIEIPVDKIGICTLEMKEQTREGVMYMQAFVMVRDLNLKQIKAIPFDSLYYEKSWWGKLKGFFS